MLPYLRIYGDKHNNTYTHIQSESETGTGLGLFISKSIIEGHGGKIWAENNADGKGATFYFCLSR